MNWYFDVLKRYAVFRGRARRKEYWMFFLFNVIISFVLMFIDGLIGLTSQSGFGVGPLYGLYLLALFIPSVAVSVRRLHDTNRSAWWLLIGLVPLLGGLILVILMCFESQPEENRYGPSPKAVMA